MKKIRLVALVVVLGGVACQNSGEGHVLGIEATGVVAGLAYLDQNGNRVSDAGDVVFPNLPIRLVAANTHDTAARGTTGPTGTFVIPSVPVGKYQVIVDSSLFGDSIRVTRLDTGVVTVGTNDTLAVRITVGFPELSIPAFRALPSGKKAFVVGVALNPRGVFGDTTFSLADPINALRLIQVRQAIVGTGDSVRAFGSRSVRDGQPVLDRGSIFALGIDAQLPLHDINSTTAATAQAGALDAAFVRILNARIMDTATVAAGRLIHVNDNSGPVEVLLLSIVGFIPGPALAADTVGARFDVYGVLIPTGPGAWRVQPRAVSDMIKR